MLIPLRRSLRVLGPILLLAAPAARAQTFEGTLTTRVAGMPAGASMKTFFSKGKLRMEVVNPGRPTLVMITDPAAGKQYMLMPEQGVYMAMDLKSLADAGAAVAKDAKKGGEATMKATGRKEMVAGLSCEHYSYEDGKEKMDLCLTSALGKMPGGASAFGPPPQPGKAQDTPAWARELARKNAFAVKVADAAGKVIWEVTGVERKALAPALFAPPAGYRQFQMPAGVPGVKPPVKP